MKRFLLLDTQAEDLYEVPWVDGAPGVIPQHRCGMLLKPGAIDQGTVRQWSCEACEEYGYLNDIPEPTEGETHKVAHVAVYDIPADQVEDLASGINQRVSHSTFLTDAEIAAGVRVLRSIAVTPTAQKIEALFERDSERQAQTLVEIPAEVLRDLVKVAQHVSRGRRAVPVGVYPDSIARKVLGALSDFRPELVQTPTDTRGLPLELTSTGSYWLGVRDCRVFSIKPEQPVNPSDYVNQFVVIDGSPYRVVGVEKYPVASLVNKLQFGLQVVPS